MLPLAGFYGSIFLSSYDSSVFASACSLRKLDFFRSSYSSPACFRIASSADEDRVVVVVVTHKSDNFSSVRSQQKIDQKSEWKSSSLTAKDKVVETGISALHTVKYHIIFSGLIL